jgi:hypothetical protein
MEYPLDTIISVDIIGIRMERGSANMTVTAFHDPALDGIDLDGETVDRVLDGEEEVIPLVPIIEYPLCQN